MISLENKNSLYSIFSRKKKDGKKRIIHAPCLELKQEQRKLMLSLQKREWISEHCYGFKKGSSISSAASNHIGKDWILNIDIKNFFPSINENMLSFLDEYEKELATLNGTVVQGSPCSPIISNIILRELDEEISNIFGWINVNYSRYADDIVLSGYGRPNVKSYIHIIRCHLKLLGFEIKDSKIDYSYKHKAQKVLGINVNNGLSVNRKLRKKLRAIIHQDNLTEKDIGTLAFINSVNQNQYSKLYGLLSPVAASVTELY